MRLEARKKPRVVDVVYLFVGVYLKVFVAVVSGCHAVMVNEESGHCMAAKKYGIVECV